MENQAQSLSTAEERLINIVRRLPPEHVSEVLDFAEFLERRGPRQDSPAFDTDKIDEAIAADDTRWDALLASAESQSLLDQLADEALASIKAGHAQPVVLTDKGEIAPG